MNLVKHWMVEMATSLPMNKYGLCEAYTWQEWVNERDGSESAIDDENLTCASAHQFAMTKRRLEIDPGCSLPL
ncbi:hypothetical protein J5N97_029953 [Dioscorea zingiberensis]|uniref:Uncharacterized protein n=1 Tax=Dioscorea zingiberensis TaxID=325984 RepID=A0A9D5BWW7_9LILI|nr:hypothetical protein J5N97_029953 [Dioscorea zingiberensis]